MAKHENLYCKMFIDIDCKKEELINLIAEITNGNKHLFRTIETNFGDIDVNENDDFISEKNDGSFLYYKFYLDIEPAVSIDGDEYIAHLSEIIKYFLSQEIHIVPACDFEDELPHSLYVLSVEVYNG